MKDKIIKNLVYSQYSIPKLAKYDRINQGLKKINLKKTKSALDLGCGVGQTLYALNEYNFSGSYMGVDNDPKMIKIANNFFANHKYKNY